MQITISGKDYDIHFGMKFIRELDKKYYIDQNGVHFGAGLETVMINLFTANPAALSDILYLGTCTEKVRPMPTEVDAYIEAVAEEGKMDELFDRVRDELKNSPLTAKKFADMENEVNARNQ